MLPETSDTSLQDSIYRCVACNLKLRDLATPTVHKVRIALLSYCCIALLLGYGAQEAFDINPILVMTTSVLILFVWRPGLKRPTSRWAQHE